MEKIKKDKKSRLVLIGFLLLSFGVIIISLKYIFNIKDNYIKKKSIEIFYKEQLEIKNQIENKTNSKSLNNKKDTFNIKYIAILKIPKIKLEQGLVHPNSQYNNVNKNIQILKESDFPNTTNSNLILAAHSGSSNQSFFKNLNKLNIDDEVFILYNGKEYKYKVINYYEIEKNGKAHIIRNAEKTTLTLITCIRNTNKQIIYICELI